MCLEPDPDDPLANARHTNAYVQKQGELLAPVELKPLRGSIAKTHLWHGLHTLKRGGMKWHQTDEPMMPNNTDEELTLTLRDGMFYETLRFEAYRKHPKAVIALMQADNYDAAFAMAEDEIALTQS